MHARFLAYIEFLLKNLDDPNLHSNIRIRAILDRGQWVRHASTLHSSTTHRDILVRQTQNSDGQVLAALRRVGGDLNILDVHNMRVGSLRIEVSQGTTQRTETTNHSPPSPTSYRLHREG